MPHVKEAIHSAIHAAWRQESIHGVKHAASECCHALLCIQIEPSFQWSGDCPSGDPADTDNTDPLFSRPCWVTAIKKQHQHYMKTSQSRGHNT